MDIIVVSNKGGRTWRIRLDARHVLGWLPLAGVATAMLVLVFMLGFWVRGDGSVLPTGLVNAWAQEVSTQRVELSQARQTAEQNAHALARRIAELQAHMTRVNAAGARLTELAGLDSGEFNFEQQPAIGGPEDSDSQETTLTHVLSSFDQFEDQLSDRERQMRVLEDLLLASRLQKQVQPSGWPVPNGWISSIFGRRIDPFTGRYAHHAGIDFAARQGSDVLSVAAGIVTEAGDRFGYGRIVEINHGNGYVTRYGHNEKVLVKAGDRVNKGQRIALMGSTGRSTGPHVHFEVLYNGSVVDPARYIQAAR